jgi:SAM-dependent methyltransferase
MAARCRRGTLSAQGIRQQEGTMSTTQPVAGSAAVQGRLWGARARDWAELQEPACRALHEAGLDALAVGEGTAFLDVGCGTGFAARLAADRGARAAGIDAAPPFIAIARERVADAEFRVGEMEELPFADGAFDAVSGFNSFQYATNPVRALAEARRVARPGAPVLIATWGDADDCEASGYIAALGSVLPPPPPGAPGPFALSQPGALEELASDAGLTPRSATDIDAVWSYPDDATTLRALLSAGPAVKAIEHAGEDAVVAAVRQAVAPFRDDTGGYRLENRFRFVIATA